MTRVKRLLLLPASIMLLAFAVSDTAYAGEHAILAANNQLKFQYVSTYVNYGETGGIFGAPSGLLDTEKGVVPGFGFDFSLMKNGLTDNGYLDIEISNVKGHTNYVGGLISPPTPYGSVVSTSGATITDYSLRLGKGFWLGDDFIFTPFLEVGHHYWDRGVNYGETYKHNYYGAGALAQTSFDSLVVSVNGMIGRTFGPSISVNFPAPIGFSAGLGNSMIWRVGGAIDYAVSGNLHFNAGVDYTRFKYGHSGLNGPFGAYEPDSSTKYTTVKAGVGFAF